MSLSYERPAVAQQRLLPETFESALRSGMYRIAGFVLCVAATIGWLSLLTWSVTDPSPMHATGGPVKNLLGTLGATVSDILLQMLGVAAVFALLAPMLWGGELIATRRIRKFRLKALLFPLAVLMLAAGCSALPTVTGWPLRHGMGGFLGDTALILAGSAMALLVPGKSLALAGLMLFAGGCGLVAFCTGLSRRDMWRSLPGLGPVRGASAPLTGHPHAKEVQAGERLEPVFSAAPAEVVVGENGHPDGSGAGQVFAEQAHSDDRSGSDDGMFSAEQEGDREAADLARRFAPAGAGGRASTNLRSPSAESMTVVGPVAAPSRQGGRQKGFEFPSLTLLKAATPRARGPVLHEGHGERARQLEDVLGDFGIKGEIKDIRPGPVVTVFELEPQRGTKSARVIGLADDIGRSMGLRTVRISVVPGRNALGIEIPNETAETVLLREILETAQFRATEAILPIALGRTINGEPVIADLARMPHLLVAGTTGSGKSVGINAMILSLLYRHAPQHCRMLMIDPKMLELSVYNDIPHLLAPVVTDPHKAVAALNWVVSEMEERYKRMAKLGVRNVDGYNKRVREARALGQPLERCVQTGYDPETDQAVYQTEVLDCEELPYIVVVVDEFADLMLVAGKEIEAAVQRLAQMARAAGIHLIMATQRPSVDVITGTIKANFPSRISFKVASKIDSRTILNEQGAEQLLGHGDMLFLTNSGALQRVHGAFVGDEEVESVARFLRSCGAPNYVHGVTDTTVPVDGDSGEVLPATVGAGDLYRMAREIVVRDRKASTSYLQRRLSIGYNRAADLIDRLEAEGVISPQNSSGRREVLIPSDEDPDF